MDYDRAASYWTERDRASVKMEREELSETALRRMPEPVNLIRIVPSVMDFLCSGLKRNGHSIRQQLWMEEGREG